MFRKFASSAGAFQRTDQNKNAGREADHVKQENKRTNVHPEAEQRIDNQKECEENHSESFHTRSSTTFSDIRSNPVSCFPTILFRNRGRNLNCRCRRYRTRKR